MAAPYTRDTIVSTAGEKAFRPMHVPRPPRRPSGAGCPLTSDDGLKVCLFVTSSGRASR